MTERGVGSATAGARELYLTEAGDLLRPCEMLPARVGAFLAEAKFEAVEDRAPPEVVR